MAGETRSVGAGFREHDARIDYFIKYAARQNFGDYLPEIFCKELLTYPRIEADVFRLVGSVIDDRWARQDLRRVNGHLAGLIAYWGCGARGPKPLSDEVRAHCRFFGVRGPATRDLLGLSADTVLGDPGLLAPLFHQPRPVARTAGKTICIPHIHDPKPLDRLLAESGCDLLVHPEIEGSEAALRTILDEIAAADFVLTASLHGAIVACAYGRPFAFWDTGHIDVPFKWEDFAGSVGIDATFVRTLAEGRAHHARSIAGRVTIPSLAAILDAAPFVPRPSAMLRALARERGDPAAFDAAAAALEALPSARLDAIYALQDDSGANRAATGAIGMRLRRDAGLRLKQAKKRIWQAIGRA